MLAVHHLVGALCIITSPHPVHHIERIAIEHRIYYCHLFSVVVDKFALIGRTDIEPAIIAAHSQFVIVDVTLDYLPHGHFYLLDGHHRL